jgi:hypothetical protein
MPQRVTTYCIKQDDREKTAYSWKNGYYEYIRMPFGLCNALATFQRIMDKVFKKEIGVFVMPYLDDIIVYSKSVKEHLDHLYIVFGRIKSAGLSLNKSKCNLFKTELKILGSIVWKGKIRPDPENVEAIIKYNKPTTVKELKVFWVSQIIAEILFRIMPT